MKPIIAFGSDHGGFELKEALKRHVNETLPGYDILDLGTAGSESTDYPEFAQKVSDAILNDHAQLGVLCCGTGIGMSIQANRNPGIRAAVVHDLFTAEMAKAHNNANILCFGGRVVDAALAKTLLSAWISTPFEEGRHRRRIDKLG